MQVLVIGGGASGMMAAITAAAGGCRVTLLEQNPKLGKKLYATGNGKCNLTNLRMRPGDYRGTHPEFAWEALECFSVSDTLQRFADMGLLTKERNGYVYPHSEQAQSVVSVLCYELRRLGVRVLLSCRALEVERDRDGFSVTAELFEEKPRLRLSADRLILASGGLAGQNLGTGEVGYAICRAMGHRIVPTAPALVQLRIAERFLKPAAGVRLEAEATLHIEDRSHTETGELLFADYGVSGIPILQLSRYASLAKPGERPWLSLNFFPDKSSEERKALLDSQLRGAYVSERTAEEALCGLLPDKLLRALLSEAGILREQKACEITAGQRKKLESLFFGLRLSVSGTNDFSKAQVTAGGVDVSEVCPETMESLRVPGMYLTGELLDIDGTCGGYNLQWAWTSGALAGKAVVEALHD